MKAKYNLKPLAKTTKNFLTPSPLEFSVYIFASLLLYCLVFINFFINAVVNNDDVSGRYLDESFNRYIALTNHIPFAENASVFIIWALIGAVCYILSVFLVNSVISLKNNRTKKMMNSEGKSLNPLVPVSNHRRILYVSLLISLVVFTIKIMFPYLFGQFHTGLTEESYLLLLVCVVGMALCLYVIYSAAVMAVRNPEIIAKNN